MSNLINAIEFLGLPTTMAIVFVGLFLIMQIIGELLEFKGKIVPEMLKIRKYFARKKQEKNEITATLQEVKQLLADVNCHYSQDNITKRDTWIDDVNTDRDWMHARANTYDQSILDIKNGLLEAANQLRSNTKMTEDMFIENSRDRIIDFAERASDSETILSHEQFRRIFRVPTAGSRRLVRNPILQGWYPNIDSIKTGVLTSLSPTYPVRATSNPSIKLK